MLTLQNVLNKIQTHIQAEFTLFLEELSFLNDCRVTHQKFWLPEPSMEEVFEGEMLHGDWHYQIWVDGLYCFSYSLQFNNQGEVEAYLMEGLNDESFLDYHEPHQMCDTWEEAKETMEKRVLRTLKVEKPFVCHYYSLLEQYLDGELQFLHHHGTEEAQFLYEKGTPLEKMVRICKDGSLFERKSSNDKWKWIYQLRNIGGKING